MIPPINAITAHSADATTGRRHESVFNVDRNSPATNRAINASSTTAGSCALTTEYGGAAHEPSRVGGQLVARHPVVAGLHDRQRGEQHGDVRLGGPAHLRPRRLDDDAAVEHVGGDHQQRDEHQRGEQPVEHERDERQAEHVEADVVAELRIVDAERLLLRNSSQSCQCPTAGARTAGRRRWRRRSATMRSRWPKNSWNRSTTGWVLAENADGASRSAITRLSTAKAMNVPPNSTNISSFERSIVQNTPARPTESCHR